MVQVVGVVEDLARAATNMVDGALAVATGRMHLEHPEETFDLILREDGPALDYFRHELAHQIAMILIRMDPSVIEVHKEHELPEAEELGAPQLRITDPLHLVVYSERETAALRSLIAALDQSLGDALRGRVGRVVPGLIVVDIIDQAQARRVGASAGGFRPPPTRLVSRGTRGTGRSDENQAL